MIGTVRGGGGGVVQARGESGKEQQNKMLGTGFTLWGY